MPLRISSREAKLQQMQQQQQLDIQQQQADQQQQAAMLGAVSQLYNLNNTQQMQPLQMQSAQLANDTAAMNLSHMPNIYDLQQRTGESGLQSAEQARMLNANVDTRAQAMHDPELQHAGLVNAGLQTNNDMSQLQLDALPEQIAQNSAAGALNNNLLRSKANWVQPFALQEWYANNANLAGSKAHTSQMMNPGILNFSPDAQMHIWDPNDNPAARISVEAKAEQDVKAAALRANGFDPLGNPITHNGAETVPPLQDVPNPYILNSLSDLLGAPMDFTNKLTNDLIAPPYDWLAKGLGSNKRFNRLPTSGGSNAARKAFNLKPTN